MVFKHNIRHKVKFFLGEIVIAAEHQLHLFHGEVGANLLLGAEPVPLGVTSPGVPPISARSGRVIFPPTASRSRQVLTRL